MKYYLIAALLCFGTACSDSSDKKSSPDAGNVLPKDADMMTPDADLPAKCGDCATLDDTCNIGTCENDTCVAVPRDCSGTGNACTADATCDPQGAEGNCDTVGAPSNEGLSCDNCEAGAGNCSTCSAGTCQDAPVACTTDDECAILDDVCNARVCEDNTCVAKPLEGVIPCNDQNACTTEDLCQQGACVGTSVVCAENGNDCNSAESCDPQGAEGNCDIASAPSNEGLTCDDCDAGTGNCSTCTAGVCLDASCGDSIVTAPEECDDGNQNPFDGCSATCNLPVQHLLISEIVTRPTSAEFVEIYNPTNAAVDLGTVYLADFDTYYNVTTNTAAPGSSDFLLQFPAGATIAAGAFVTISLKSSTLFQEQYGIVPNFDLSPEEVGAPAMLGTYTAGAGLSNGNEIVMLFQWDGVSELVTDLDYVNYGPLNNANKKVDKTGIAVGASTYLPDTAEANQISVNSPSNSTSAQRCDTAELTETTTAGNGIGGRDVTSEDFSQALIISTRTPSAAPPAGACAPEPAALTLK